MAVTGEQQYRNWVEVDLDNFTRNGAEIRRLVGPDCRIMQVVKADAYGHGAIEISHVALRNGAAFLGVANADEGVQLRVGGINAPIVILSPSTASEIAEIIKYNLTPSVSDPAFARELDKRFRKAGRQGNIHIEVDTGMGRGGTMHTEARDVIAKILGFPNLTIEGVFTHLSSSEVLVDYNEMQWRRFADLLAALAAKGIRIPLRHMANSGAVLNFPRFHLDMVRPGLMSYGIYPSEETKARADLAPVMSFKTRIVLLKEFPRGYSIGYGRTFTTGRPTQIATIPVGYGDGYGWILSNLGEVLVGGRRAPIVGRVSMDMCTVDVSGIAGCRVGDEVVLMGRQGDECISADEVARKAGTISYEIICALGKRAPRVFLHEGRTDAVEPRLRRIFIPDEERSLARIGNIIRRCCQTRASNAEVGDAIYYEMFETLFGKEDRQLELRTDLRYAIDVAPFAGDDRNGDRLAGDYFRVTTRIAYTKTIRNHIFMIGCALDNEQLAALFEDKDCEYRWLVNRGDGLVVERDFRIGRVCIDGQDVPVLDARQTERGYEFWCGGEELKEKVNRPVRIEIDIVTRKSKLNNIFTVYLVYPTRGVDITFHYGETKFRNVREVSFFAGKHPSPQVTREPGKTLRLTVGRDEWIFPTSGVAFIWDL